MTAPEGKIRTMSKDEVLSVIPKFYHQEHLSYALHDFSIAPTLDSTSFLCCEANDEIVGTISLFKWDSTYAFGSAFVVLPEHRKKGYSVQLSKASKELGGDRNVGIDVVDKLKPVMEKGGFQMAYNHDCYVGVARHMDHSLLPELSDLSAVPFSLLVAYDAEHFPVPRPDFLALWLKQPNLVARAYFKDGKLLGYGALKEGWPCRQVGPLYAANEEIAHALLASLINTLNPGDKFELCAHTPNENVPRLVNAFNLEFYCKYNRMYNKRLYTLPDPCIYCASSTDLG